MTTVSAERLAAIFVAVADTLAYEFDRTGFLRMLADRVAGLVAGAGVGILLADQKHHLHPMAASDETAKLLGLLQRQRDGPCVDAFHTGRPVVHTDLTAPAAIETWPWFARHAAGTGFRSVHAIPLRLRHETIGAMGLFGRTAGDFDAGDVRIVRALADVAAIGLLQERAVRRAEALAGQLQSALHSRVVIEQAKGVIAQRHRIDVDAAFEVIRAYARRHHLRLGDVAHTVVTDLASLPELAHPRAQ